MDKDTVKEKIERLKIKTERFLKENKKCFVKDINETYYFCYLLFVGENKLYIENFKGKRFNAGIIKEDLNWEDVIKVDEYVEKEVEG